MSSHNILRPIARLAALIACAASVSAVFGLTSGDVVYRTGGFLNNSDHAGIYYGNIGGVDQVYEIRGYGTTIQRSQWSTFQGGETYLGAFATSGMTQAQRNNVLATCAALDADPDITYTVNAALYHQSNVGTYISVDEITDVRCDGLVEYAYEWNNVIWVAD